MRKSQEHQDIENKTIINQEVAKRRQAVQFINERIAKKDSFLTTLLAKRDYPDKEPENKTQSELASRRKNKIVMLNEMKFGKPKFGMHSKPLP